MRAALHCSCTVGASSTPPDVEDLNLRLMRPQKQVSARALRLAEAGLLSRECCPLHQGFMHRLQAVPRYLPSQRMQGAGALKRASFEAWVRTHAW